MRTISLGLLLGMVSFASLACAEPPKTPVTGPQLLCFKYSTFSLLTGEQVTEFSGSAEGMMIKIQSPAGSFEIAESDIFAGTKKRNRVFSQGQTTVYSIPGAKRRYAVYGPTIYSEGHDRLVIWLSGAVLNGSSRDVDIYRRFDVRDPASAQCGQGFSYSWEFMLGDAAPLSDRP